MPYAPPKACKCGALVPYGRRCPRCAKAHDKARGTAHQRGYDGDWKRVRAEFIKTNPVCDEPGCGRAAIDADHIVSVREAPHRRLDPTNLRPYCHAHHSERTRRDQGGPRPRG
ncbi:HNH endonuclease [Nitrospirillum bahiense]|uniref:5-methylcytosine-specific restriction protein A n=1 Tax=Nitrospirillum amazonense TaxID=28077 RepID=A0A560FC62_9PROT|nr:HNH endonuclease [Nitrospirillum amazonense]TWB19201.1 hypothetical protein FBZ88_12256 [Nitrospirillum amazonense]